MHQAIFQKIMMIRDARCDDEEQLQESQRWIIFF